MNRRLRWLVLLFVLFLMSACNHDDSTGPDGTGGTVGDWAGFWETAVVYTLNDCEVDVSNGCVEIIQEGNTIWFADEPSLTMTLNPSGEIATYFVEVTVGENRTRRDGTMTLYGDAIIGILNTQRWVDITCTSSCDINCTSSYRLDASRASACVTAKR